MPPAMLLPSSSGKDENGAANKALSSNSAADPIEPGIEERPYQVCQLQGVVPDRLELSHSSYVKRANEN